MPAKRVKPPRDDGPVDVYDFDRFTGQTLYVPLPNDNRLRMARGRNMAKLRYIGVRKPMNQLVYDHAKPSQYDQKLWIWVLQFHDLHALNDAPLSLTIHTDGTVMLGNCRSKFFSNYWHAYAWGLRAKRCGWW